MTTVSSKLLNELEQENDQLKKENFDLKMQLYYANNSKSKISKFDDSPNRISIYDENEENLELNNYKFENERLRNKVNELELEILELKIKNEKSNNNNNIHYESIQPTASDIALMEENRRRERQAAMAIAEHDSAIISHLEKEIERLQSQHKTDSKLINQCADKVSLLTDLLRSKEDETNKLISDNNTLLQQIDLLNDKIKHRESIIRQNNIHSENMKPDSNIIYIGNNSSNGHSYENEQSDDILKYGAQISLDELKRLRRENIILRDQIDRERGMLKSQEEILQRVRQSAEELTLLEAEEIARLEKEVNKLNKENEKLKSKCEEAEANNEIYRQRLAEFERSHQQFLRSNNSFGRNSFDDNYTNTTKSNKNRQTEVANKKMTEYNDQMIEMYKQREMELLNALDSVVKRCQALEKRNRK